MKVDLAFSLDPVITISEQPIVKVEVLAGCVTEKHYDLTVEPVQQWVWNIFNSLDGQYLNHESIGKNDGYKRYYVASNTSAFETSSQSDYRDMAWYYIPETRTARVFHFSSITEKRYEKAQEKLRRIAERKEV